MRYIQAPKFVNNQVATVFLAGSIEMGVAEQWQERVVTMLKDTGWTVLNPRRDDWDNTWEQKISFEPFYEQVSWELQGLETCEKAIVYFAPDTKAPITLLELGLLSQMKEPKDIFVVCPEGFYRKGNVDIVCDRYRIKQYKTLKDACEILKRSN
jgi:Nucleoside 2-deoxyribosyltransferase like